MVNFSRAMLAAMLILFSFSVMAKNYSVGSSITLKATHKKGVPLHREARSSMKGRVPHGSKATVMQVKRHWYRIKLKDGKTGWIIRKYIARNSKGSKPVGTRKK